MASRLIILLRQSAFRLVDKKAIFNLYFCKYSKGSILIISLWSICLLTTFAVILGYGVRQKILLVQRFDERDKLHLIAEAGIKKAICQLNEQDSDTYDALKDDWSNNIGVFKDINVGDGKFNICYNYIDAKSGMMETRWGLIDEERKININNSDLAVLARLFRVILGGDEVQAQELAASIIDWRDGDSELSIPLGSAEDSYYRYLRYPYEAKDAEFQTLQEILLVKGMDNNIFEKIKDYITIYGNGRININTTSKEVLLALGLNEGIVDKILSFRLGEDEIIGTSDDNIFETTSNIVPKLSQSYHLNDSEIAQLSITVERYLVTNSDYFMIRSLAKLNNRKNTNEVICVMNKSGKVLSWQES